MGITLSVAYDFAQNINMPNIRFTTPLEIDARNGDNLIYKTVIKLDHEHLNIGYNDSTINRLPHEYGGFRITLSLMEF